MTVADEFIRDNCCSRACLEAETKRRRCRCVCAGRWHGSGRIEDVGNTDLIQSLQVRRNLGGVA